jgi:hypothetical protein
MEYKFSNICALSFEDLPEAVVKMTLDLLSPPSFSEKHRTFQSGNTVSSFIEYCNIIGMAETIRFYQPASLINKETCITI